MKRPLVKILYRDLVKRTETLRGDLRKSLNRDLTLRFLQRAFVEISHRHLAQIAIQRDLAQQFLHRTCHEDLSHDLLQTSSQSELAESNLVSQYLFTFFATFGVAGRVSFSEPFECLKYAAKNEEID